MNDPFEVASGSRVGKNMAASFWRSSVPSRRARHGRSVPRPSPGLENDRNRLARQRCPNRSSRTPSVQSGRVRGSCRGGNSNGRSDAPTGSLVTQENARSGYRYRLPATSYGVRRICAERIWSASVAVIVETLSGVTGGLSP